MCGGGRPPRATITMPDRGAYDRQFDLQKSAIDATMNNGTLALQSELNGILRDQNTLRGDIADWKRERAEDRRALDEQARRLSVLMGPPLPEKTAQSVEIGTADRELKTRKGKKSLRIGRTQATSSGQGTGLNIT